MQKNLRILSIYSIHINLSLLFFHLIAFFLKLKQF